MIKGCSLGTGSVFWLAVDDKPLMISIPKTHEEFCWSLPTSKLQLLLQLAHPLGRIAATVCPTVAVITVILAILKRASPDIYRTCRFWDQYLPIHVRYLYTRLKYSERRGYTAQVHFRSFLYIEWPASKKPMHLLFYRIRRIRCRDKWGAEINLRQCRLDQWQDYSRL